MFTKDTRPPSPRRLFPGQHLFAFQRESLKFLQTLARDYGDISSFDLGGQPTIFINHPDLIHQVLVTNQDRYVKGRVLQRARVLLGDGLLTSEVPLHRRQRRLAQPAFHRARILSYGATMSDYTNRLSERWSYNENGKNHNQTTIDIAREMNHLTLAIVGKTLFDTDVESESDEVGRALTEILRMYGYMVLPFSELLEKLPIPAVRRFKRARFELDRIIYGIINERRQSNEDKGDLLSMLMLAKDEKDENAASVETNEAARRMNDKQVRDEALTLFLAGHETTANWLAWAWHLIARHAEVERCLHEEVDTVLRGRAAQPEDLPNLPYTEKILTETLRVRPPAWALGRLAIKDDELAGYRIPANTLVLMSQFVMHRDARYFDAPHEFRPERWTKEMRESLPAFAFFPFGGGARRCIGESFAWMEAIIVLATLAARWRVVVAASDAEPAMQARITLRPQHGIPVKLERRATW